MRTVLCPSCILLAFEPFPSPHLDKMRISPSHLPHPTVILHSILNPPPMSSLETFQAAITVELRSEKLTHDLLWRSSDKNVVERVKQIALDTLLSLYPTLKTDTGTVLFSKRAHGDSASVLGDAQELVVAHLQLLEFASLS